MGGRYDALFNLQAIQIQMIKAELGNRGDKLNLFRKIELKTVINQPKSPFLHGNNV